MEKNTTGSVSGVRGITQGHLIQTKANADRNLEINSYFLYKYHPLENVLCL